MKRIFLKFTLLAVVLVLVCNANASNNKIEGDHTAPQSVISSRYILGQKNLSQFVLSGAMTAGKEYSRLFGGQVALDYRFDKRFSVGAQGNLFFKSSDLNGFRQYEAALRANYHVLAGAQFKSNPFDLYFGLSLGSAVHPADVKFDNAFIGAHAGLRYNLDQKWMIFTEVGTRNAALGLALNF